MKPRMVLALALLACCNLANGADVSLDDFAYGIPMPLANGQGAYSMDIPLQVYEKSLRPDLGDVRVFNGAHEIVPHAIRRTPPRDEENRSAQILPFFPLPGKQQTTATDLAVRVKRDAGGAIITVDADSALPRESARTSYLLDATKLTAKPNALEMRWQEGTGSFFTISLSQSNDLAHWFPLVEKAVLADFQYEGNSVTTRTVALPSHTMPYIRIDCVDCREPLQLQTVTALSGTRPTAEQWQWLQLAPTATRTRNEELLFEYRLDAKVAVTALQLQLPEANSLVRAIFESRPSPESEWQRRAQGNLYHLNLEGKILRNELLVCNPTSDRNWRLRILADKAGLNDKDRAPRLELGWRQEQLVFLGRGNGPYMLAFGSNKLTQARPTQDALVLETMRETNSDALIKRIDPGPMRVLAGDQAMKTGISPLLLRKIALWGVLLLGVVLLAIMVKTVYRELQEKK